MTKENERSRRFAGPIDKGTPTPASFSRPGQIHRHTAKSTVNRCLRNIIWPVTLALLWGCGSSGTSVSSKTQATAEDTGAGDTRSSMSVEPWFCESGESDQEWECVRDRTKATRPQPTKSRLPSARLQSTQSPNSLEQQELQEQAEAALEAKARRFVNQQERAKSNLSQVSAADSDPASPSTTAAPTLANSRIDQVEQTEREQNRTAHSSIPNHIRLAYKPENPTAILDLPADFWAVQLISVSEKAKLEKFAKEQGLRGMSAARIWSQNQFFYVLILGIYEDYDKAKLATEQLPAPFDAINPWIRSVGSLQKAMVEADRQAGNATP